MKIQLFITCLIDSLFPEVGEAVVEVLHRAGVMVEFPEAQTCCGQPAFNAGYWDEARRMALHTMNVFHNTVGPVVVPSGSCAHMIKQGYIELFQDDPVQCNRAKELSERVFEFSQFLVDVLGVTHLGGPSRGRLAYHPSCHLLRGLGIDRQPKALLGALDGDVFYLAADCCGFGGVFAIDQSDISVEMLKRKIMAIDESGADIVVGCDVSCLMHIDGGLRRLGSPVRCAHLAQILSGGTPGLK